MPGRDIFSTVGSINFDAPLCHQRPSTAIASTTKPLRRIPAGDAVFPADLEQLPGVAYEAWKKGAPLQLSGLGSFASAFFTVHQAPLY